MQVMYLSLTMGNVVETRREVLTQILKYAIKFHTLDLRWVKVLYDGEYVVDAKTGFALG